MCPSGRIDGCGFSPSSALQPSAFSFFGKSLLPAVVQCLFSHRGRTAAAPTRRRAARFGAVNTVAPKLPRRRKWRFGAPRRREVRKESETTRRAASLQWNRSRGGAENAEKKRESGFSHRWTQMRTDAKKDQTAFICVGLCESVADNLPFSTSSGCRIASPNSRGLGATFSLPAFVARQSATTARRRQHLDFSLFAHPRRRDLLSVQDAQEEQDFCHGIQDSQKKPLPARKRKVGLWKRKLIG